MNEDIRQDIVIYRMGKAHQLLYDVDILVEDEIILYSSIKQQLNQSQIDNR